MFEARSARDMIRKRLVTAGAAEELEQLIPGRADADLAVLRREVRLARARAANQALVPLSPDELLAQWNEA